MNPKILHILAYVGVVLYVLTEWYLPRTNAVAARSVLELVANVLRQIPVIGQLIAGAGTPPGVTVTATQSTSGGAVTLTSTEVK